MFNLYVWLEEITEFFKKRNIYVTDIKIGMDSQVRLFNVHKLGQISNTKVMAGGPIEISGEISLMSNDVISYHDDELFESLKRDLEIQITSASVSSVSAYEPNKATLNFVQLAARTVWEEL